MISIHNLKTKAYTPIKNQNKKYVSWGIDALDLAFDGLSSGTVTVITGRPSEGKSTFLHGIILNAVDTKKKVYLVDGEYVYDELFNKLFRQVIGNDNSLYVIHKQFIKQRFEPIKSVRERLTDWFGDRLNVTLKYESDLTDFDIMFKLAEANCKAHNIDMVIFDNLMSLIDSTSEDLNTNQSKFIKRCSSLAKSANVAVILVSHPNTSARKGEAIDYYQISGTGDLANVPDNIIQVIKDPIDKDAKGNESINYDGRIIILKNRHFGEYPIVNLAFDVNTGNLCEIKGEKYDIKEYNWQEEGEQQWIIEPNPPF